MIRRYGRFPCCRRPCFFMACSRPRDAIEIEPGKTLVLVLMTIGATDEKGSQGFLRAKRQPRIIWVRNLDAAVKTVARRKPRKAMSRMLQRPCRFGLDHRRTVGPGREDRRCGRHLGSHEDGDRASRAARRKIAEILVTPGQQIDARDLLMRWNSRHSLASAASLG